VNTPKSSKLLLLFLGNYWFLMRTELPGKQVRIKPQMVAITFRTPPASGKHQTEDTNMFQD
jgi:hypothetical protein